MARSSHGRPGFRAIPVPCELRTVNLLTRVERAFRSMKTVNLHVRPIYHRIAQRVRAHIFLCTLAYYVEWHISIHVSSQALIVPIRI